MLTEHLMVKVVSHFFSLIDNQFAPKKWQFPMTKYINFCMHVALTYLWTCLFFWGGGGGGGQMGLEAVVVAWHKAELINFSYQFDFLTSFTNLLHLSLNISCIIILFWENQHCMEMNLEQRKASQRLPNRVDSFATHAYSRHFHWTNVLAICVCYSKPTLKFVHHIIG